jgi:hypothetical protein
MDKNPYGGGPGTGITLPPYFRPTPSVASASNYYPLTEKLGPEEMRISFVGGCPFPPKRDQAGTACWPSDALTRRDNSPQDISTTMTMRVRTQPIMARCSAHGVMNRIVPFRWTRSRR